MHGSHCSICKLLVIRRGKPGKAHSTQTVSLRSCSTKHSLYFVSAETSSPGRLPYTRNRQGDGDKGTATNSGTEKTLSPQTQWLGPLLTWLQSESESESESLSIMSDSLQPIMDCSPPGSSVRGILQARILEWVAISSSRGSSQPRDWTQVPHIAGEFFIIWGSRDYRMVSTSSAVCDPCNSWVTRVGSESGVPCTVIDLSCEWLFSSSLNHTFLRRAKWG